MHSRCDFPYPFIHTQFKLLQETYSSNATYSFTRQVKGVWFFWQILTSIYSNMPKYLKQTCPSNYCNCSIIYIYRERERGGGGREKWCYKVLCIDSSRFRPVLSFDFIKLLCFQLGFLIMMFVVSVWYFNRKMRWDQRKNKTNTWFQDVSPAQEKI